MYIVWFLSLFLSTSAIALPPDQAAAQETVVSAIEGQRELLNLILSSYDNDAKLFAAELKPGSDKEALVSLSLIHI